STQDPQPEPPSSFLQPRRVQRLVQQMAGQAGGAADTAEPPENQARGPPAPRDPAQETGGPRQPARTRRARPGGAARVRRRGGAGSEAFGRMVAAEAKERDFYRAQRKAFVADGAAYNWKLQERRFAGFTPIVDFLHVVCYVYRAAWAVAADEAGRWRQYVEWLR